MEPKPHKNCWYFSRVAHEAWDDWSWTEIISEGIGGLIIAGILIHSGIAEASEAKELILEGIGCAMAIPLIGFLIRFVFTSPAKMYKELESRLETLEEHLRPKFKLECGAHIIGCRNMVLDQQASFYRIQVQSECANEIENCIGHLTKIEKDGEVRFNSDSLELPFAPSESSDALNKTIFPGIPYYLDVLLVTNQDRPVQIAGKGNRSLVINQVKDLVFLSPGEYILHVSVSGKGVVTSHIVLKFNWIQPLFGSTMQKLEENPIKKP